MTAAEGVGSALGTSRTGDHGELHAQELVEASAGNSSESAEPGIPGIDAFNSLDCVARVLEELDHGPAGEESEMGAVQDALILIAPVAS